MTQVRHTKVYGVDEVTIINSGGISWIGSNPSGFAFVGCKKLPEADGEECH